MTARPSADWITYGKYRSRREKKIHTKRAAELRMRLRQIVRAWHTYVESNRLYRQQCLTDIMVRANCAKPTLGHSSTGAFVAGARGDDGFPSCH